MARLVERKNKNDLIMWHFSMNYLEHYKMWPAGGSKEQFFYPLVVEKSPQNNSVLCVDTTYISHLYLRHENNCYEICISSDRYRWIQSRLFYTFWYVLKL